ncbi:hypothetical protein BJY52DRAFT_1229997 [Lactarius psammicola]|nr:hypothetical protein BJY52DRAFT_1229997 [Lactarius psammicola]
MMEGTLADDEGESINPDEYSSVTTSPSAKRRGSQSSDRKTPCSLSLSVLEANFTKRQNTYDFHVVQARTKKRQCLDTPGRTSLCEKQKKPFDEVLTTPRAALHNRQPGRGWAALSSHASSSSQDEYCSQEGSATVRTASKGKQKEAHDRSSVEVEQLLPLVKPVHDPRNFYASDSPVIEDPDSDQDLYKSAEEDVENVELDGQGDGVADSSNSGSNVRSSLDHLGHPNGYFHTPLPPFPIFHRRGSHTRRSGVLWHSLEIQIEQTNARVNSAPITSNKEAKHTSLIYSSGLPRTLTLLMVLGVVEIGRYMADVGGALGHGAKACETTTVDFMIDIAGDLKSPWNVSAGRAFTDYFIEKIGRDDTPEMRRAIEKAFDTRIRSLKSRWKRDMLPQTTKVAERSKHSRRQRKYQVIFRISNPGICLSMPQLFQRRREITKLYDSTEKASRRLGCVGSGWNVLG